MPVPDSAPSPARAIVPPVLIAGVAVVAAVWLARSSVRIPVAVCGLVVLLAVAAVAGQNWRHALLDRERRRAGAQEIADLRRGLAEQEEQIVRLAESVLPAAMVRLRQGDTVDEVMDALAPPESRSPARAYDPGFHAAHLVMLRSVLEAVKAEEDLRESAQRAFVNIARRVQAIVHRQFQELREMEDRHGRDSRVFGDLLKLDHGTALIGRLADSISVLGGSRPGRQWQKNVPLFNVLRGAVSRITDYRRVDLHSVLEVAVVGPAVEPLIHALAELLDNATRYSPPHTRVHLTAVEVQSGVAIEIEDGGVGLSEEARTRAERVFSQASAGLDLTDLGETPRLGLSVVGRLARANGFQVALRPSAYAGVRAVLVLPRELVSTAPAPMASIPGSGVVTAGLPTASGVSSGPGPSGADLSNPDAAGGYDEHLGINGKGLPQRRRRSPVPTSGGTGAISVIGGSDDHDAFNGHDLGIAGASARTAPSGESGAPVPPGLWLAAFHNTAHDTVGTAPTAGISDTADTTRDTLPDAAYDAVYETAYDAAHETASGDESSGSPRAAGDDPSSREGERA